MQERDNDEGENPEQGHEPEDVSENGEETRLLGVGVRHGSIRTFSWSLGDNRRYAQSARRMLKSKVFKRLQAYEIL